MEKYSKKSKMFLVAIIVLAMIIQLVAPMIIEVAYSEENEEESKFEVTVQDDKDDVPVVEEPEESVEEQEEAEEPKEQEEQEEVQEEPKEPKEQEESVEEQEEPKEQEEELDEAMWGFKGKGSIEFTKYGEIGKNNKKELKGAKFGLYNKDGKEIDTEISNGNGYVKFKNVPIGEYTIKEIEAPEGYELSEEVRDAEIVNDKQKLKLEGFENKKIQKREGSVEFIKYGEKYKYGHGKVLAGAKFGLYDKEGNEIATATSDKNGLVRFENVPLGTYTLKEIQAPEGYELSEETRTVKLYKENQKVKLDKFENKKARKGSVEFIKYGEKYKYGHGKVLAGAKFGLYDKEGNEIDTEISNGNGYVKFKNVPIGEYTIKEIEAPEGYELSEEVRDAEIVNDKQKLKLEGFENKKIQKREGSVEFIKYGEKYKYGHGKVLAGAKFGLYDKEGNEIATATSDKNGLVRFENVPLGTYTLKEIQAPEGYELSEETRTVKLYKENQKVKLDKFENKKARKGSVEFIKYGEKYKYGHGKVLAGAKFGLYDKEGNEIATATSDKNGLVRFENVPLGTYTLKEIQAPEGYELSEETRTVKLYKENQKVKLDKFENKKARKGSVEFIKYGEKYKYGHGKVLAGAKFGLYDKEGNEIATATSDKNGLVRFENVPLGTYTLKEIQAPEGYELSEETRTVKLYKENQKVKLDKFENKKARKGSVEFIKYGEKYKYGHGKVLAGAKFGLYDKEGNEIATATSDKNGLVRFENVPLGTYTLKEIQAPEGYELSEETRTVKLYKENQKVKLDKFENKKIPEGKGTIKFFKKDEKGNPLAGAKFGLYDKDKQLVQTQISDNDGLVKFEKILLGEYVIREIEAPEGYKLLTKEFDASLENESKVVVLEDIKNEKKDSEPEPEPHHGIVKLKKVDEKGDPLSGAKFGLYDKDKQLVQTQISDNDGLVKFEKILLGEYVIREIEAPEGYKLLTKEFDASLENESKVVVLEDIKNEKKDSEPEPEPHHGIVKLKKVDEKGDPLSGAKFGLYDKDKQLVQTQISDNDGLVKFEKILLGEYVIREIEAPEGYKLLTKEFDASLENESKVVVLEDIKNEKKDSEPEPEPHHGIVKLKKVDEKGDPLSGARFGIYDKDGKLVQGQTSDNNGLVRFDNMPIGEYTVKEISAPTGYRNSDRILKANISKNGETIDLGIFTNYKTYKPGPDKPGTSVPSRPSRPDTSVPSRPDTSVPSKPDVIEEDEIEIIEEIPEAVIIPEVDDEVEEVIPESTETTVPGVSEERVVTRGIDYAQKPVSVRDRLIKTGAMDDMVFYIGGLLLILVGLFVRKKLLNKQIIK